MKEKLNGKEIMALMKELVKRAFEEMMIKERKKYLGKILILKETVIIPENYFAVF